MHTSQPKAYMQTHLFPIVWEAVERLEEFKVLVITADGAKIARGPQNHQPLHRYEQRCVQMSHIYSQNN
jgi:hypothetical protein